MISPSAYEPGLPRLFNDELAAETSNYRGFRHVARMAYGVELKRELMLGGIDRVEEVFSKFERAIPDYLGTLNAREDLP